MLISIITNKTNTTNPVMSQVSPTSLVPLEVSNRSSFHSSLPNFPPHLPDFPLCLGEKTENSCCVLFGDFSRRCMYYIIYIYYMSPIFFWNLECLQKKCEDFFFLRHATFITHLFSNWSFSTRQVFFGDPMARDDGNVQSFACQNENLRSFFSKRVKQGLIIYWTKVCFFFQGEKNELKV